MVLNSVEAVYISLVVVIFASIFYLSIGEIFSQEAVNKNEGGKVEGGRKKEKKV